ncbi:MAG: UDP-4-amino-4,6-dideoxy-N-acetyl-beta-L-altrosamine transaminase [Patescibacteria group bacterium]|jgi:UDP-4-amino-4,6-dideoxy-N-acetyl-beta-L-altrosamine transaminase
MNEFISYGKQWIDHDDIKAVEDVLKSDFLTQGPKVEEFEKAICDYTGAKYCIAVSNGTAALHLAVASLGLSKGSEGISTPITFVASSNGLVYNGLKPVFADIDSKTYNINPDEIKKNITEKTKVIIAVDFAGQPAEMEKINKIAKKNNLFVVEDAAHAIGSVYKDGSKVGSCKYSDLTTFSFHPVKTITTGEGGAITTNDEILYKKLLLLRSHGITKDPKLLSQNTGPWYYEMQDLGYNYRMCDIQAALGISQLKKIEIFRNRRREIVIKYNKAFSDLDNVTIPYEKKGLDSTFHLYVMQLDFKKIGKTRTQVMEELRAKNIGTQVLYIPVHTQPYYQQKYGYKYGEYPVSEAYYEQALSIPLYPKMSDEEVNYVIDIFNKIIQKN